MSLCTFILEQQNERGNKRTALNIPSTLKEWSLFRKQAVTLKVAVKLLPTDEKTLLWHHLMPLKQGERSRLRD